MLNVLSLGMWQTGWFEMAMDLIVAAGILDTSRSHNHPNLLHLLGAPGGSLYSAL